MPIHSKNPYTNAVERSFDEMSDAQIATALDTAEDAYKAWKAVPLAERADKFHELARILRSRAEEWAQYPTIEMGKLFREGRDWEVPVCADIATYYANNAEAFLAPRHITLPDGEADILSEPTGVLLGVMPWNFPYYQVFRFAVPNLMAGNVCVVKHASNVPQCALALAAMFREAGFPAGVYTNLLISARKVATVIEDRRIRGISLTGSEAAGARVAEQAGRKLKKAVMELGGSDPFIVLDDADVDHAVDVAFEGKMFNAGQCCAAAKRFIVFDKVAAAFTQGLRQRMAALRPGDPREASTSLAPLVSEEAAQEIVGQIQACADLGAKVLLGGDRPQIPGAFVNPTILTDLKPGMPGYDKEIFGPVASLFVVKDEDEAIALANGTDFGLGSVICTRDEARARRLALRLEAGMVYVNTFTISQPDLPFGGVKNSGFGRELSSLGIEEFLNKKLVRVKR